MRPLAKHLSTSICLKHLSTTTTTTTTTTTAAAATPVDKPQVIILEMHIVI